MNMKKLAVETTTSRKSDQIENLREASSQLIATLFEYANLHSKTQGKIDDEILAVSKKFNEKRSILLLYLDPNSEEGVLINKYLIYVLDNIFDTPKNKTIHTETMLLNDILSVYIQKQWLIIEMESGAIKKWIGYT